MVVCVSEQQRVGGDTRWHVFEGRHVTSCLMRFVTPVNTGFSSMLMLQRGRHFCLLKVSSSSNQGPGNINGHGRQCIMACQEHASWRCRDVVRIARLPACSCFPCTPCCSMERLLRIPRRPGLKRERGRDRWSARQCHYHSHGQGGCARGCRGTASGALPHTGASTGCHRAGACEDSPAENAAHTWRSPDREHSVRDQGRGPHPVFR